MRWMLYRIFDLLILTGIISKARIRKAMGYPVPTNFPVPGVTVPALNNLRIAIFAMSTIIDTQLIGVFVKEQGASDYTCVGGGVNLNMTLAELKAAVEAAPYNGDERKWLQVNIFDTLNTELDNYLRSTFDWEKLGNVTVIPNDDIINAMPNEIDQMNAMLAKYGSIQVDTVKQTINVFA